MTMTKKSASTFDAKRRYHGLLALCIITTILLSSLIAAGIQTPTQVGPANSSVSHKAPGSDALDPIGYLNGYHLYDVVNWNIPSTGQNFTLSFPPTWNVSRVGLDFFNGTLQNVLFINSTTVTTSVTSAIPGGYLGYISNLKVPANSTVYQAMFNITGLTMGDNNFLSTINGVSNSDYPVIDGNIGIGQRFFIPIFAESLLFQVNLFKFDGTVRNLTAEVRRSTYDNNIGEMVGSASVPSTAVSLGSTWVTINVQHVNLTAGYYFIVLHTDGWLSSGGGYVAQTTLSNQASSPPSGWMTSNRGINWQSQTSIAGSSYYFNGFKLRVHITSLSTPYSNINLRINDIPVADNHIWNQSVWNTASPYRFTVTSINPITTLNFTYKVWYYVYGHNNPFRNGYHIQVNNNKNTTSSSSGNFTLMRITLDQTDLMTNGVMNTTTGTITLKLGLFNGSGAPLSGSVNVTAWAQLAKTVSGLTFGGPYSLILQFIYSHPGGSNNVTLSEAALSIVPINSQIDNVYVNTATTPRNSWSYYLGTNLLNVFREAFTSLPQFTLIGGSTLNSTVSVFNNFTASASSTITGYQPDTTPVAKINIQNATPLLDIDGLTNVNITITNPNGLIINNSQLSLSGGQYKFNFTVSGEGIYGIKFISNDSTGNLATRWIGIATVSDLVLAPPTVTLSPASNLTSQQMVLIFANASYVNHPELAFNGNLTITIYVGDTGNVTQLTATWNSTTKLFQAAYQAPAVDSTTQLSIRVQACDAKHRISTVYTSTYVTPQPQQPIPQVEPSSIAIILIAVVAVLLLVPTLAYFIEKYRKK